jgi:pullulanase
LGLDHRVLPENYTDMVIYELHVRDFSIDEFSGITHKGKLAFTSMAPGRPKA